MITLSVCIVLLATCLGFTSGYGSGAHPKACQSLEPIGHTKIPNGPIVNHLSNDTGLWTIASACYVIFPNDKMSSEFFIHTLEVF